MARGMPPRPPAGGGRAQPPRRGAPPKTGARPKPAQPQKPGQKPGQTPAQKAAQTRHLVEQQRQNAAKAATKKQQHSTRQALYLREAHGKRKREEAEQRTAEIHAQLAQLERILADGLARSAAIDLETLYQTAEQPPFDPGPLGTPTPEPALEDFTQTGGLLAGAWGGQAARARRETAAKAQFDQAREQWRAAEEQRAAQLAQAQQAYEESFLVARERVEQYNSRIARVAAGLRTREPAVVASFLRTVLRQLPLPAGFPRRCEVTYDRDQEQVAVRLVLPGPEVVPPIAQYEYLAPVNELRTVLRPPEQVEVLYRSVIGQVALLAVRDILDAEPQLAQVSLTGLVDQLDPETGEPRFAQLLRVSASRAELRELDLTQPVALSLRALSADLSA